MRAERQSLPWRIFAVAWVVIYIAVRWPYWIALVVNPTLPILLGNVVPLVIAVGVVGYAFGLRIGTVSFWRMASPVLIVLASFQAIRACGVVSERWTSSPMTHGLSGTNILAMATMLALITGACIALLRYARFDQLRAVVVQPKRSTQIVIAILAAVVITGAALLTIPRYLAARADWKTWEDCRNRDRTRSDEDAIAGCTAAIAVKPYFQTGYYNRGVNYLRINRYDLAMADFDHVLALNPRYSSAYEARAFIHAERKRNDLAIADLNRAIAIRPEASRYYNRGLAYVAQRQYALAIADYTRAIDMEGNDGDLYAARADAERRSGDAARADADDEMARELGSTR